MQKIFISYRRDDSRHSAGRICDRLVSYFGKDQVFMDIEKIPLGVDFRQYVKDQLEHCKIVLAVIGDDWLIDGNEPSKNTHIELATALERADIPVIPVLVGDAPIPNEDQLPDDLKELSYRNGIRLHADQGFDAGMKSLIKAIEREAQLEKPKPVAESGLKSAPDDVARDKMPRTKHLMIGIGAVILTLISLYFIDDYMYIDVEPLNVARGTTEPLRLAPGGARVFGFSVPSSGTYRVSVISSPEHLDQGWYLYLGRSEETLKECNTDHPARGTETCEVDLETGEIYDLEVENLMGDRDDEESEPVYFTITVEKL
ncbi:MAG TPA: toll/interleukin-1 receptor domain-containing protein [Xanthomonadales bacterium]|nr:toll/interleukin-1 receptor domain-containing protein [Xanthomonadales bacterium]